SSLRDEMENDLLITNGEQAFYREFQRYCNNCNRITGTKAGEALRAAAQEMLGRLVLEEAFSATGAMNHFRRHQKYLPLDPDLEFQIQQFGQALETQLDKWKTIRRIYTTVSAADTFSYLEYVQKTMAFAQAMENEIAIFKQDFEQSSQFPGMYLLGKDSRYFDKQYVHLRQIGNYVGNPMYYKRAHDKMRAVLSGGRIRAALKEFAALENTLAYHKLYDLYIWLDQEDWLAFDQGGKLGSRRSVRRANNNYKFKTKTDLNFAKELDIGFAELGGAVKGEIFLLEFNHNFLPLKYDMYIGCASVNLSASLGVGLDPPPGLTDPPPSSSIIPEGENINSASRSHIFHYPSTFFAGGSTYTYGGISSSVDLGPVNGTEVWFGEMTFNNSGRDFTIGTEGHNISITPTSTDVGITILESGAGAGFCYGTGIHNFTGLPQQLEELPAQAMEPDSTRFASYMMPMIESQTDLGPLNKEYLDRVVEDLKTMHAEFGGRGATVRLMGSAAGIW
ncbi:MAG: hypothetical protein AAF840_15830, partial [Bacteroidota bacterium]